MRRFLVALILVAGCSAETDSTLDITFDVCQPLVLAPESETTAEELAAIDVAIDLWNRLGESRLTRDAVDGAPVLPLQFDSAATAFHGLYDDEHGVIYINHELADAHERAVTISHELGHAFGLWHIGSRVSVMNKANLIHEPNEADRDDLIAIWGDCP